MAMPCGATLSKSQRRKSRAARVAVLRSKSASEELNLFMSKLEPNNSHAHSTQRHCMIARLEAIECKLDLLVNAWFPFTNQKHPTLAGAIPGEQLAKQCAAAATLQRFWRTRVRKTGKAQVLGSGEMCPRAIDDPCAEGLAVARPSPQFGGPLWVADSDVTRSQTMVDAGAEIKYTKAEIIASDDETPNRAAQKDSDMNDVAHLGRVPDQFGEQCCFCFHWYVDKYTLLLHECLCHGLPVHHPLLGYAFNDASEVEMELHRRDDMAQKVRDENPKDNDESALDCTLPQVETETTPLLFEPPGLLASPSPSLEVLEDLVGDSLSVHYKHLHANLHVGCRDMAVQALVEGHTLEAIQNQLSELLHSSIQQGVVLSREKTEAKWPGSSRIIDIEAYATRRLQEMIMLWMSEARSIVEGRQ